MGHLKDDKELDKSDGEPDEEKGNDQKNGVGDILGPSTTQVQKTVPTVGKNERIKGMNQQEGCERNLKCTKIPR